MYALFLDEKRHYLITGNAHHGFKLEGKLSVFRRPYSESHKLDIACIRWLEPLKEG